MRFLFAARRAVFSLGVLLLAARPVAAQTWNDPRTRALVEAATARRVAQLADTALESYHAVAHGYVTFLAQVGSSFLEPPRVVKADELVSQVYWHAPDQSKQIIEGRRDTLLLPTDIRYHADHLGIVQNNFPATIRIGEGDEVRDVPHPLSPAGLEAYDFAVTDSLRISLPGRAIEVYEVKVRPKDETQPRVVGALYLDRSAGQVVRMTFNFTHAAFIDRQLEDVSIVLDNGLVQGSFWLPRRQEIEIRRTGTYLDFPVRGIIRGRWEIGDYQVNVATRPQMFGGPEIVQVPTSQLKQYPWQGRILDSLPPDVLAPSDADVQRVQAEARALVSRQALQRASRLSLSAHAVSDFVRFDRVEGLAVGGGLRQPLGGGFAFTGRGRYGFSDYAWKGSATLSYAAPGGRGLELGAHSDLALAGEVPEMSGVVGSLASQEFGVESTDPFSSAGFSGAIDLGEYFGMTHRLSAGWRREGAVDVHATPAAGAFMPTIPAQRLRGWTFGYAASRPTSPSFLGTEVQGTLALSFSRDSVIGQPVSWMCVAGFNAPCPTVSWNQVGVRTQVARVSFDASVERPLGGQRLVTRWTAAAVRGSSDVPAQDLVYFGGPVTAPGYDFHELVGTSGASARLEWRTPVPFIPIPLGRFGHAPASATLAPYVVAAAVHAPSGDPVLVEELVRRAPYVRPRPSGVYPTAGLALLTFFDLARLDVAYGLRHGGWRFTVDVNREFWGIL